MSTTQDARPASAFLHRVSTQASTGEPALSDITFSVERGEVLALLGVGPATLSGNSAVLQTIAGFTRMTSGQVTIAGRMMHLTPPHRRGLGVVTRNLDLFPHLDVGLHASFSPGTSGPQASLTLTRLGLHAFARRAWQNLSPELQFRTALARALSPAPRVLLLEDPFPALPQTAADPLKSLLRGLATETGLSILLATDDIASCYGLADRVGVMQSGTIRQIGTAKDLYENPLSLAIAQAMGPLNQIPGAVVDIDGDIAAIRITGGAVVEARFDGDFRPGNACIVTIRPERVAVAAVNFAEMGEGAIQAHLIDTSFAGDVQLMRFALDTKRGNARELLVSRPSGATPPRRSDMCLAWQAHHARAFRADAP